MYRVVSNEALKHLQWIVVREDRNGRPVMQRGPFADEATAQMHCDALNRELPRQAIKSIAAIWSRWFGGWVPLSPAEGH